MKQIIIDGRVGANGTEVKTTKNGKNYARFSIANNTYVNGEEKTEWYDVICYDPIFIEKRAQYLGKGSYVIITGTIKVDVNVKDGKFYLNQTITAQTIDTPRFGGKKDDKESNAATEPSVSTFTGGTKSDFSSQVSDKPIPNVTVSTVNNDFNDDDLPF